MFRVRITDGYSQHKVIGIKCEGVTSHMPFNSYPNSKGYENQICAFGIHNLHKDIYYTHDGAVTRRYDEGQVDVQ